MAQGTLPMPMPTASGFEDDYIHWMGEINYILIERIGVSSDGVVSKDFEQLFRDGRSPEQVAQEIIEEEMDEN